MDSKYLEYYPNEPVVPAAQSAETPQPQPQSSVRPVTPIHPEMALDAVEILKVSAHSRPGSVAGAIAGVVRQVGRVEIQAIGAGATNQAIKAIAIARGYLISSGIDIYCIPAFIDIIIDNEERTAIKFMVDKRATPRL